MTGLSWRRKPAAGRSERDLRRHSADVSALFRSRSADLAPPDAASSSVDLSRRSPPSAQPAPKTGGSRRISNEASRSNRLSLLRFRNASDPTLGARARTLQQQRDAPPIPDTPLTPSIITTAPTFDSEAS